MMHGSRGKNTLKLIGSVRGEGLLRAAGAERAVSYHLDRYEGRQGQTATGEVDGPLAEIAGLADASAVTLVLSGGRSVAVTLSNVEDDSADIEVQDASDLG